VKKHRAERKQDCKIENKDKRSDWFGTSFLLFRAAPVAFWSIGGNTLKPNRSKIENVHRRSGFYGFDFIGALMALLSFFKSIGCARTNKSAAAKNVLAIICMYFHVFVRESFAITAAEFNNSLSRNFFAR